MMSSDLAHRLLVDEGRIGLQNDDGRLCRAYQGFRDAVDRVEMSFRIQAVRRSRAGGDFYVP